MILYNKIANIYENVVITVLSSLLHHKRYKDSILREYFTGEENIAVTFVGVLIGTFRIQPMMKKSREVTKWHWRRLLMRSSIEEEQFRS